MNSFKLFVLHLGFNVVLLAYHAVVAFVVVMAAGGAAFKQDEAVRFYISTCFIGILPNIIIIVTSYFFQMHVKKNIIIEGFFLLVVLAFYLFAYRVLLNMGYDL